MKSKSKELEKREMTESPYIWFSLPNSLLQQGKGVITVNPCFVPLPKESQDLGPLKQVAMTSHGLLSDKVVTLL